MILINDSGVHGGVPIVPNFSFSREFERSSRTTSPSRGTSVLRDTSALADWDLFSILVLFQVH